MANNLPTAQQMRLRRQVIAEWRGFASPRPERPLKELSDEVGPALEKLGMQTRFSEEDIMTTWSDIVPPIISGNTRPSALRNGVLEISVLQPAILYTLEREMKRQIVQRLQSLFGRRHIRDVRFRIA